MNYQDQTSRNIELSGRYIQYLIDRPHQLETIEEGESLILTDPDDPELSAANEALAESLRQQGKAVRVVIVPQLTGR